MPKNLRNFWVEAAVDGRRTPVKFGPRAKDGGFRMTFYMRVEGVSIKALTIEGKASDDDKLLLMVNPTGGQPVQIISRR